MWQASATNKRFRCAVALAGFSGGIFITLGVKDVPSLGGRIEESTLCGQKCRNKGKCSKLNDTRKASEIVYMQPVLESMQRSHSPIGMLRTTRQPGLLLFTT